SCAGAVSRFDIRAPRLGAAALSRARGFLGGARARGLRRTPRGLRGHALARPARLGQADRDRLPAALHLAAFAAPAALERAALVLAHLALHILRSAACVFPRHENPPACLVFYSMETPARWNCCRREAIRNTLSQRNGPPRIPQPQRHGGISVFRPTRAPV